MSVYPDLWKQIGYKPHRRQLEFHQSQARFKLAICGRRFGKSRMAAAEVEPDLLNPNKTVRGWIVAPQYDTGEKEFRYIWDDIMRTLKLEPLIAKEGRRAYNLRTGEMYIQMPWGSRLDVKSAERTDSLIGEGLDFVIMSEAAKQREEVWDKYIRPALADHKGKAIFPTTPEGFNWLYPLYLKGVGERKDPDWQSWNFPSWENPYVYPGGFNDPEVQAQLKTPDDPVFWQELGADFRSVVGLVYPEWNDNVHIIDDWKYRPDWPNHLAVDFGWTNPFAGLDIQVGPQDELVIWREHYHRFSTAKQNAEIMRDREQPEGYSIDRVYADSASPDGCQDLRMVLDVPVIAWDDAKNRERGIPAVKDWLVAKKIKVVRHACPNVIREFNTCKTPMPGRKGDNTPEDTEKKNNHALDAIRYEIMHHFVVGADSHLDAEMVNPPTDSEYGGEGIFRYEEDDSIFSYDGSVASGW